MSNWLIMVPVPEVEPGVAQWRERFDPAARRGLGAHVTLLHFPMRSGPMQPGGPASRDPHGLQRPLAVRVEAVTAGAAPFSYKVTRTARFPGTLYLAVEPAEPFANLREHLLDTLADIVSGAREAQSFVPHVSVVRKSQGDDRAVEQPLNEWLARHGPVRCQCSTLVLLEDSTGRWRPARAFALSGCTDSPSPAPS